MAGFLRVSGLGLFICATCLSLIAYGQSEIPEPPVEGSLFSRWQTQNREGFKRELKLLEKRIAIVRNDADLVYRKGILELGLANYPQAIESFQKYLKARPADVRVLFQLARANELMTRYPEALDYYKRFAVANPKKVEPLLSIVALLERVKEQPKAYALSRQIATSYPDSLLAQTDFARTLRNESKKDEALALYQRIAEKWPDDVHASLEIAEIYLGMDRQEDALQLTQKLIKRKPEASEVWVEMAVIYTAMDKGREALESLESMPNPAMNSLSVTEGLFEIGSKAASRKDYQLAIKAYEKLMAVDPDDYAKYKLGQQYAAVGRKREAEALAVAISKPQAELAKALKQDILHPEGIEKITGNTCPPPANEKDDELTKPIILYKEKARYTDRARNNRIMGVVTVSVVLTADGRVTNIRVVYGLPDGLNEEAVRAARVIRFKPSCRKGKPVSIRMLIEYEFNLI